MDTYIKPSLYSSHYLMALINQILDFTRKDFNEDPRMTYEKINIRKEVKFVEQMFKMKA